MLAILAIIQNSKNSRIMDLDLKDHLLQLPPGGHKGWKVN